MIIKSKKDTYANLMYDNNSLDEVNSFKYLYIDLSHRLNYNYNIEKRINGGWKSYLGIKIVLSQETFDFSIIINPPLRLLLL